ncbi:MAG: hypothetical protein JWM91_521 [Rhodospirillales bacterium]|nr:hypothetical protein [Rhodospirillales bacterium]
MVANLIWTSILYFSTSTIMFIAYRTFVNHRKAENKRRTSDVVFKTQAQAKARDMAPISALRPVARRPAVIGDMKAPVAR